MFTNLQIQILGNEKIDMSQKKNPNKLLLNHDVCFGLKKECSDILPFPIAKIIFKFPGNKIVTKLNYFVN